MNPDPAAAIKWPNVPACHGWLSLDRRGVWRLKGEPVRHAGLIAFINSQYGPDAHGNWIFQNGPQAVYVTLDYTPLVLRLETDGRSTAHTGVAAGEVIAAYLDEGGSVLLHTALGIGLIDDRDLPEFFATCRDARGRPADEDALLAAMEGGSGIFWNNQLLQSIPRGEVPARFGFRQEPPP